MGMQENLEAMLAAGQDNPLLRFTLGNVLLKQGKANGGGGAPARGSQAGPGLFRRLEGIRQGIADAR